MWNGADFNILGLLWDGIWCLQQILKLPDFKVLSSSGQRISDRAEQQIAVSGPETGGTDGSLL